MCRGQGPSALLTQPMIHILWIERRSTIPVLTHRPSEVFPTCSIDAPSSTVVLEPEVMVDDIVVGRAVREAIRGLDALDISAIFSRRASVMRSPPKFLSGAFRSAMRVALHEIVSGD